MDDRAEVICLCDDNEANAVGSQYLEHKLVSKMRRIVDMQIQLTRWLVSSRLVANRRVELHSLWLPVQCKNLDLKKMSADELEADPFLTDS